MSSSWGRQREKGKAGVVGRRGEGLVLAGTKINLSTEREECMEEECIPFPLTPTP